MKKIRYHLRNIAKMIVQNMILPAACFFAKLIYRGEKDLWVFADAHHTDIPFSLEAMYKYVVSRGITPVCHFHDYTHEGMVKSLIHSIAFMKLLVRAKVVFICDTFVPVSSGKKTEGTTIVQLCHYSGPLKKLGYATEDDIPAYYGKNVFKNYDLVTASSEMFVPLLQGAMRQPEGVVKALGVSRSDVHFDPKWIEKRKKVFYGKYPEAKGKKVLLWAPTFRGKASDPNDLDNESFVNLQSKLGDEWLVLIKHHPHDDAMATDPRYRSNCSISSDMLLPVVDMLITDYSTVVLDYLAYGKPFILYAPDLEMYESTRGFFVDYRNITKNFITSADSLDETVKNVYSEWEKGDMSEIDRCRKLFTSACDGRASERIYKEIIGRD